MAKKEAFMPFSDSAKDNYREKLSRGFIEVASGQGQQVYPGHKIMGMRAAFHPDGRVEVEGMVKSEGFSDASTRSPLKESYESVAEFEKFCEDRKVVLSDRVSLATALETTG